MMSMLIWMLAGALSCFFVFSPRKTISDYCDYLYLTREFLPLVLNSLFDTTCIILNLFYLDFWIASSAFYRKLFEDYIFGFDWLLLAPSPVGINMLKLPATFWKLEVEFGLEITFRVLSESTFDTRFVADFALDFGITFKAGASRGTLYASTIFLGRCCVAALLALIYLGGSILAGDKCYLII